jgi:hypothetical protein
MAPIKFEENIKDKLDKRTLSPSSDGWSKLSDRLDADEKKSKTPLFWWLSIAAGLIIMIAVSVRFFNNGESEQLIPVIVEDQKNEKQIEPTTPILEELKTIELAIENNEIEPKKDNLKINEQPKIRDYKKETIKTSKSKTGLAQNTNDKTIDLKEDTELNDNLSKELNESLMKEAVVDALIGLKSENTTVTDREIDSLLKVASKELFKDKLQKDASKTVDANALLLSVEEDMGQSFRSKVFDALKGSYETVKTAVAERNN